MNRRPDSKLVHRFRSKVLAMQVYEGQLFVLTERGVYRPDKKMKRWRKVAPAMAGWK